MKNLKLSDSSVLSADEVKKIRRSALIKLAVSCVLLAAVIIFNTISWFSDSKETSANGLGVRIIADHGYDVNYRAFKYDLKNESHYEITGDSNILELNEYDTIFTERNKYAGILLRLEVDGNFEDVSGTPKLRIARDLSIRSSEGYNENEDILVSDVTQFHVANENECGLDSCLGVNSSEELSEELWEKALEYFFYAEDAPVSAEFTTDPLVDSIDLDFTPSEGSKTVLWLFINYDSSLIQDKMENNTVTLNELISVDPDCTIFKVTVS